MGIIINYYSSKFQNNEKYVDSYFLVLHSLLLLLAPLHIDSTNSILLTVNFLFFHSNGCPQQLFENFNLNIVITLCYLSMPENILKRFRYIVTLILHETLFL